MSGKTPEEEALGTALRAALRRVIIDDLVRYKSLSPEAAEARVARVLSWEEHRAAFCSCGPSFEVTVTYQDSREDLGYASFHSWEYQGDMAELMRRLIGE